MRLQSVGFSVAEPLAMTRLTSVSVLTFAARKRSPSLGSIHTNEDLFEGALSLGMTALVGLGVESRFCARYLAALLRPRAGWGHSRTGGIFCGSRMIVIAGIDRRFASEDRLVGAPHVWIARRSLKQY